MANVEARDLPQDSLLALHRGLECHRDAYAAVVPGEVSLGEFITAFYSSIQFMPERKLLGLIGRGASRTDIGALADGRADSFAAWDVEARAENEILLRDFQDHTCSWLMVEFLPSSSEAVGQQETRLWFGSGVRNPDRGAVSLLMPFHHWYSRVLLGGAVRRLG